MKKPHLNVRSICTRLAALVLAILLLAGLTTAALAVQNDSVTRMNVMLVIDGSGSLKQTDPNSLRYDAIDLFLAMLTNSGNNAGAIVFDHKTDPFVLYSPISPMNGKADKVALAEKIKIDQKKLNGDTNIGGALLEAVKACEAATNANGLPSVVILFSDGRTDFSDAIKDKKEREAALAESLQNKEDAIVSAQLDGIPVYSICLDAPGAAYPADPAELEEVASRTGGSFVAVQNPEDLTKAFETFYQLIFSSAVSDAQNAVIPDSGEIRFTIDIPSYGAEEVNVILNNENLTGKSVVAPNGVLTNAQVDELTMTGGDYHVIKLVDPESGRWEMLLSGQPGKTVTINVLYNVNSTVALKTADGKSDYEVGENITFQANLLENGNVVTDGSVTGEYNAVLHLTNLTTGKTEQLTMTPGADGTFSYQFHGSEYASYTAVAELTFQNLVLSSSDININFGNTAPGVTTDRIEVKQVVTPISGKSKSVDISQYFYDAQDTNLTYTIVSSQLVQDTAVLDSTTGLLTVNTGKSKSGEVVIQAADSQGATAQMVVYFKVTNLTALIFGLLVGGVLVGAAIIGVSLYAAMSRAWHGTFTVKTIGGLGSERAHGDFRGKVQLKKLGLADCTVDGAFVALGSNQMEFRATKPVYTKGGIKSGDPKRVPLMSGSTKIYSDEACTRGIQIDVKPKLAGGGMGGFGGMGGGAPRRNPSGGMGGLNDLNKKPDGKSGGFGGMGGGFSGGNGGNSGYRPGSFGGLGNPGNGGKKSGGNDVNPFRK